tara:strand:- start:86 stop:442 length:357 start_codon:yes stop_codon:yes gene_type:complete
VQLPTSGVLANGDPFSGVASMQGVEITTSQGMTCSGTNTGRNQDGNTIGTIACQNGMVGTYEVFEGRTADDVRRDATVLSMIVGFWGPLLTNGPYGTVIGEIGGMEFTAEYGARQSIP